MSAFYFVSFHKKTEWWFDYHYFLGTLQQKWPDIDIPFLTGEEVGPEFYLFFSEDDPEVHFTEYGFSVDDGIDIDLFASIAIWLRGLFPSDQYLFIDIDADPSSEEMELRKDITALEIVYFFEKKRIMCEKQVDFYNS